MYMDKTITFTYTRVIQASPPHTGSTLLVNLVHGFLLPDEQVNWETETLINDCIITKTHDINIDKWNNNYKQFKLYFVMSERYDNKIQARINNEYKKKQNVLVINFNEINVTNELSLEDVIDNIFNKFINFFPKNLIPNKNDECIKLCMKNRINNMNKLCEEIKSKPFSYYDGFYHIHGSHRNRIV